MGTTEDLWDEAREVLAEQKAERRRLEEGHEDLSDAEYEEQEWYNAEDEDEGG